VTCLGYLIPLRHVFTLLTTSEHQMWRARVLETPFRLLLCFITTSLVVTTISFYSVLWPSDFVSRSCPGFSVFSWISSDFVFCDLLLSAFCFPLLCPLFISLCFLFYLTCLYSAAPEVGCWRPGEKTPRSRVLFPVLALLRFPKIRLPMNY
jgi:hypothetical protein